MNFELLFKKNKNIVISAFFVVVVIVVAWHDFMFTSPIINKYLHYDGRHFSSVEIV